MDLQTAVEVLETRWAKREGQYRDQWGKWVIDEQVSLGLVLSRLAELEDQRTDPKPDGWHTYHICNGKMRETQIMTYRSDTMAVCLFCGQKYQGVITP